jgi:hypothetical protein
MTKYAIYDDDGIWGVGNTEEQARAEAKGFFADGSSEEDARVLVQVMKCAPMSEELASEISMDNMMDIEFVEIDGVLHMTEASNSDDDDDDAGDDDAE